MIEKIAEAINKAGSDWADAHPVDFWDEAPLETYAQAALEAMREPTPEMLKAIFGKNDLDHEELWTTMIGAALGETK